MNQEYLDNFWTWQLNDPEGALYIDGVHYRLGDRITKNHLNGFGGDTHHIKMLDSGAVITTVDLWHQGTIPKKYNIKDNAEFVR